jgi:hypothetical protein
MDDAAGWSPYYRFRRYHLFLGRFHRALPYAHKGPPPQAICGAIFAPAFSSMRPTCRLC